MNLECPICFAVLRTSVFFTVCTLYNKLGVKTVKFTNPKSKRAPFNLITYFGAFLSKIIGLSMQTVKKPRDHVFRLKVMSLESQSYVNPRSIERALLKIIWVVIVLKTGNGLARADGKAFSL